jgi:hypothetical protein
LFYVRKDLLLFYAARGMTLLKNDQRFLLSPKSPDKRAKVSDNLDFFGSIRFVFTQSFLGSYP